MLAMGAQRLGHTFTTPELSADAAFVLALAHHALSHADSRAAEAERWLRILRVHGSAGAALQALGVGEAPLAESPLRSLPSDRETLNPAAVVGEVERRARGLAFARGASVVSTVELILALAETYGSALERALRLRGTSCEELRERLPLRALA